jgi:hypothetical protein
VLDEVASGQGLHLPAVDPPPIGEVESFLRRDEKKPRHAVRIVT